MLSNLKSITNLDKSKLALILESLRNKRLNGVKVNEGTCVPIFQIMAGLIDIDDSLLEKLYYLHQVFYGNIRLLPSEHQMYNQSWDNFCYFILNNKEGFDNLIVEQIAINDLSYLKEALNSFIAVGFSIPCICAQDGRLKSHRVGIREVSSDGKVILFGDFDPKPEMFVMDLSIEDLDIEPSRMQAITSFEKLKYLARKFHEQRGMQSYSWKVSTLKKD
jgi:hypothetical protein